MYGELIMEATQHKVSEGVFVGLRCRFFIQPEMI